MSEEVKTTAVPEQKLSAAAQETLSALEGIKGVDLGSLKNEFIQGSQPVTPTATTSTPPATPEGGAQPKSIAQAIIEGQAAKQDPNVNPESGNSGSGEQKPADQKPAEDATENFVETSLGKINLGGSKKKNEPAKFEKVEDIEDYIKKRYGVDSMEKAFESSDKWRQDSQKLVDVQKRTTQLENIFQQMPEELYHAIQDWGNGKDWRKTVTSRPAFDYSQPAEKQDSKMLVDAYFPGEFSENDWKEYNDKDGDPAIKKAIGIAVKQSQQAYVVDKDKFSNQRAAIQKQAEERQTLLTTSIKSSVEQLKTSFPDMPQNVVTQIESDLVSGGYRSLFFDENGAITPDGATRLAMARFGKEAIDAISKARANEAVSNERLETLSRTPDKAEQKGGSGASENMVRPDVQKFIDANISFERKNTY